jgi:hypothetical protein
VKARRDPDPDADGDRRGGGWATGRGEGVDEMYRTVEAGGEEQDRDRDCGRGQLRGGGAAAKGSTNHAAAIDTARQRNVRWRRRDLRGGGGW